MALTKLNIRQTIEGMPLTFNTEAAGDLTVTIQFDIKGTETGVYHLHIAKGECTFHMARQMNLRLRLIPLQIYG